MKWEESLVSGTFARIFTEDEYRNYIGLSNALAQADLTNEEIMEIRSNMNFLGKVIFISSQTIDFTGEVTSLITSVCDGESVKENQIESPFDTKVKIAYAKTAEAQATADEAAESASQANTLAEAAQASADQAKQSADNAQKNGKTYPELPELLRLRCPFFYGKTNPFTCVRKNPYCGTVERRTLYER